MELLEPAKDSNKDSFMAWLKKVTYKKRSDPQKSVNVDVFGVPLKDSLAAARAAIAYVDNDVQYMVGTIPIIIAKCGSFLKDQGLYVEGVFRMSGSAKRIGVLQGLFNAPPDYGRQLDWNGFSVHDAANVLRRFLNYLPEPVIVHRLYEPFRAVIATQSTDQDKLHAYEHLIAKLPVENQYLLFYLLDLLSLFADHAAVTRMDVFNLSSVFTPGLLLKPEHAMNPVHYKISQKVVQFLIEHQHKLTMPRADIPYPSSHPVIYSSQFDLDSDDETRPPRLSPSMPIADSLTFGGAPEEKGLNRANTVPTKRARYGTHDPLQIVQRNKPASP